MTSCPTHRQGLPPARHSVSWKPARPRDANLSGVSSDCHDVIEENKFLRKIPLPPPRNDLSAFDCAAASGDVSALGRPRYPNLYRAEYWYTRPIHFAVREGDVEAVQMLLEAGADPAAVGLREDLVIMARDRGHEAVAFLLEVARARRGSTTPAATDHAIHLAAAAADLERVRELLGADPQLVHCIDRAAGHHTAPGGGGLGAQDGRAATGSRR
jgi:Ankyrin repeat